VQKDGKGQTNNNGRRKNDIKIEGKPPITIDMEKHKNIKDQISYVK
jgi:hypothetical protein